MISQHIETPGRCAKAKAGLSSKALRNGLTIVKAQPALLMIQRPLRTQFYNSACICDSFWRCFLLYHGVGSHQPKDGSSMLDFSYLLRDSTCISIRTDKPMKTFDSRGEINTQVNELLHGASMIQLTDKESVIDESDQRNRRRWLWGLWSFGPQQTPLPLDLDRILEIHRHCRNINHCRPTLSWRRFGNDCWLLFINLNYVIQLFWSHGQLNPSSSDIRRSLETDEVAWSFWWKSLDTTKQRSKLTGHVEFDQVTFCLKKRASQFLGWIISSKPPPADPALVGHTIWFYDPQEGEIRMTARHSPFL